MKKFNERETIQRYEKVNSKVTIAKMIANRRNLKKAKKRIKRDLTEYLKLDCA